jgi:hypothetical protein
MTHQPALKFNTKPKAARQYPETSLQKAVVQHLLLTGVPDMLWYSIPNGAKLAKRTAVHMKATGMTAGAADLAIIVAGHCYFMELKAKGGKQSDAQKAFEARAFAAGATYVVADNINTAIDYLTAWKAIRYARWAA